MRCPSRRPRRGATAFDDAGWRGTDGGFRGGGRGGAAARGFARPDRRRFRRDAPGHVGARLDDRPRRRDRRDGERRRHLRGAPPRRVRHLVRRLPHAGHERPAGGVARPPRRREPARRGHGRGPRGRGRPDAARHRSVRIHAEAARGTRASADLPQRRAHARREPRPRRRRQQGLAADDDEGDRGKPLHDRAHGRRQRRGGAAAPQRGALRRGLPRLRHARHRRARDRVPRPGSDAGSAGRDGLGEPQPGGREGGALFRRRAFPQEAVLRPRGRQGDAPCPRPAADLVHARAGEGRERPARAGACSNSAAAGSSHVDGALLDRERRFLYRLGQRRVRHGRCGRCPRRRRRTPSRCRTP